MMKRIKKTVSLMLIMSVFSLLFGQIVSFARNESMHFGVYNLSGEREYVVNVILDELMIKDENGGSRIEQSETDANITVSNKITSVAEIGENFIYMDMRTDNAENPYPEIEATTVTVMAPQATGNIRQLIGKDYRLYYIENADAVLEDISNKITDTSQSRPQFALEKLGIYILCFNPKVYNLTFYLEEPIYEEENWVNQDCVYKEIENLEYKDTIDFPEPPQKDGYVFTGWKAQHFVGGGGEIPIKYTMPQPIKVSTHREFFATWCLEDEYEPINIEISSNEPIAKGKENGKKITLKTNYGIFVEDTEFPTEWRTNYDSETDEQTKAEILSEWKSKWNIIGSDDLLIETATRIDDKTIEFILSGNSNDKYSNADICIEFDNSLLLPEPYEQNGEIIDWDDTKIKMDSDGVRAKMYCSDNAITLSKQNRPSTGGGGGVSRYTVTFDTNGGSSIVKQTVNRNTTVKEPEQPQKEEYNFAGWFTDKELTNQFDFTSKITKSITLYAKWDIVDKTKDQIIFTIGKTEASVFGEAKQNDVAPIIKGDRAFLPARFVAENLGAVVEWDNDTSTVIITKDDIIIVITIGAESAIVNDEVIKIDCPAFIENDRTYTPIRFIAEKLGSTVEWNLDGRVITITK